MQNRLGFSDGVIAFDVNLGCSAYPYGFYLTIPSWALSAGSKGILSVGDISSLDVNPLTKLLQPCSVMLVQPQPLSIPVTFQDSIQILL